MKQHYYTEAEVQAFKDEIKELSEVDDYQRQYIQYLEMRVCILKQIIKDMMKEEKQNGTTSTN